MSNLEVAGYGLLIKNYNNILLSMDVEASGPCPLHGDMISFAAIVMEPGLERGFDSGNMRPECDKYSQGAYDAIGMTREQHLNSPYSIEERMRAFDEWLNGIKEEKKQERIARAVRNNHDVETVKRNFKSRAVMVSDNPGFDFAWVNFECWNKLGHNPLGHSARRIGDCFAGLKATMVETQGWKKMRKAPHDHTPYNDALGNAEAWIAMWEKYGSR